MEIIILMLSFASCNEFIYHELDGRIKVSEWNFSLLVKKLEGIVLYATSSNENLLIKLHQNTQKSGEIRLYYKKYKLNYWSNYIDSINHLRIFINFQSKIIKVNNNDMSKLYPFTINKGLFKNLPIPKDYYSATNKTFIWMGNIGPYIGYGNKTFNPDKSQLIGCVDYFYFNNQSITLKNQKTLSNKFSPSCIHHTVPEYTHNRKIISSRMVNVKMFDCFLPSIKVKLCNKIQLPVYKHVDHSYYKYGNNNITNRISLAWKQNYSKDFCLMDIKLMNGNITFAVDSNNNFGMHMFGNISKDRPYKLLNKISLDKIYNLSVEFGMSDFVVKIFDGSQIRTFIDNSVGIPIKINVGTSQNKDICSTFEGFLDFYYNSSDFYKTLTKIVSTPKSPSNNGISNGSLWIPIIAFSFFLLTLIVIYAIFNMQMNKKLDELLKERKKPNHEFFENIYSISPPIRESCEYATIITM